MKNVGDDLFSRALEVARVLLETRGEEEVLVVRYCIEDKVVCHSVTDFV